MILPPLAISYESPRGGPHSRIGADRVVEPVIGSNGSTWTTGRGRRLLVAVSSRIEGTHLIDPVRGGRFSIGKLRGFDSADNDTTLSSDSQNNFVRLTHLINKTLNCDSSSLLRGIGVKVRSISSAGFQPGHVEQILDRDSSTFKWSRVGEVLGV